MTSLQGLVERRGINRRPVNAGRIWSATMKAVVIRAARDLRVEEPEAAARTYRCIRRAASDVLSPCIGGSGIAQTRLVMPDQIVDDPVLGSAVDGS